MNQRVQKLSNEKNTSNERIASLQRTLANVEAEKRELERSQLRTEKDKNALKKCLDKVLDCLFIFHNIFLSRDSFSINVFDNSDLNIKLVCFVLIHL